MDLKNGMVIKCNSKEEAKEFIKEAYERDFKDDEEEEWFYDSNRLHNFKFSIFSNLVY